MSRRLPVIPSMRCDSGCGRCCGPAPVTKAELRTIQAYVARRGITPVSQGITCPLYIDGNCSVYQVRPLICRAFGHVEGLKCALDYDVPANWLDRKLRKHKVAYTTMDLLTR